MELTPGGVQELKDNKGRKVPTPPPARRQVRCFIARSEIQEGGGLFFLLNYVLPVDPALA
jgi:hypothetical protein